jgi:hypothetical protein
MDLVLILIIIILLSLNSKSYLNPPSIPIALTCNPTPQHSLSLTNSTTHIQVSPLAVSADFSFRQPRSFPGGGLYERFDHVRLVLQLHDELIYEVRTADLDSVSSTSFNFIILNAVQPRFLCAPKLNCLRHDILTFCCTMLCYAVQCSAVLCSAVQCSGVA